MFTKIKEFLFGKDPVQSPVAAPYKVEATIPTPVAETEPVAVPVAKTKPKAPSKPRAPRKPAAK
jgi:hypothetical protein